MRGDGNCGFRCVAHSLFQNENRWAEVRHMLLQELDYHRQAYISMWQQHDFDFLWYTIDWFNGGAPIGRWMVMPLTGLVIASMIHRPVVFISEQGWNTCFPVFTGPNLSHGTDPLVIARVGGWRLCSLHFTDARQRFSTTPYPPTMEVLQSASCSRMRNFVSTSTNESLIYVVNNYNDKTIVNDY